jgi:uncharacterized DUF497 family protein
VVSTVAATGLYGHLTVHTIICTLKSLSFEWDPDKAAANVRKHGVQFSESVAVFSDDYAITIKDDDSDPDERRFVTLGMGIKGRVLAVAYRYSGENIRIISARVAGRLEREQYEAQR